jgi:hypothetical protein
MPSMLMWTLRRARGEVCCDLHGRRAVSGAPTARAAANTRGDHARRSRAGDYAPATAIGTGSVPRSTADATSACSSADGKLPNSATTTSGKNHTMYEYSQ